LHIALENTAIHSIKRKSVKKLDTLAKKMRDSYIISYNYL